MTHSCGNNLTEIYENLIEQSTPITEETLKIENQPIATSILQSERLEFKELRETGSSIRQISEIMGISKGSCQRHSDYINSHPEEFTVPTVPTLESGTLGTPLEDTSIHSAVSNDIVTKAPK